MPATRRNVLKQLVLISAGAALLPSCLEDHSKAAILLQHFKIDNDQEKLLEELTATLIPSGATPGAREVSAHLFVLKMLDDCTSKEDRDQYLRGLQQFDNAARQTTGSSFVKAGPERRAALVSSLEAKKNTDPDLHFFYDTTKRLTIQAYMSSQYFLTKVRVYELVPGRWHGCVPVKPQLNPAT